MEQLTGINHMDTPRVPCAQEIGEIMMRLAIADEEFLSYTLHAAEKAGDRMAPRDVEMLIAWCWFVKSVAGSVRRLWDSQDA